MSISALSSALMDFLKNNIPPMLSPEQIGLSPPDLAQGQFLLGVHLCGISEDKGLRLTRRIGIGSDIMKRPPMCLELTYMITAYAGAKSGFLDDHKILERVMQLFYDMPSLEPFSPYQPQIVPQTKIEYLSLSADEISKVWQFSGTALRPTLYYRLSPVPLGSALQTQIVRVGQSDFGFDEKAAE